MIRVQPPTTFPNSADVAGFFFFLKKNAEQDKKGRRNWSFPPNFPPFTVLSLSLERTAANPSLSFRRLTVLYLFLSSACSFSGGFGGRLCLWRHLTFWGLLPPPRCQKLSLSFYLCMRCCVREKAEKACGRESERLLKFSSVLAFYVPDIV
jgi:hypothetical protein